MNIWENTVLTDQGKALQGETASGSDSKNHQSYDGFQKGADCRSSAADGCHGRRI